MDKQLYPRHLGKASWERPEQSRVSFCWVPPLPPGHRESKALTSQPLLVVWIL